MPNLNGLFLKCATRATKCLVQMVRLTSLASLWPGRSFYVLSNKDLSDFLIWNPFQWLAWFLWSALHWVQETNEKPTIFSFPCQQCRKKCALNQTPQLRIRQLSYVRSLYVFTIHVSHFSTFVYIYLLSYGVLASFWIHPMTQWNKERHQTYSTT